LGGGSAVRGRLARLHPDGTVEAGFVQHADAPVYRVLVQGDGRILLGGGFTTLGNGSVSRPYSARLNADGSVDSFNPRANGYVLAFAVQEDGSTILGGDFSTLLVGAVTRNGIARVNSDDSID